MNEPMQATGVQSYKRDQVVKIINSVMTKVEESDSISRDTIYQELQSLQQIIEEARKQIGSANAGDIKDKHVPTATDELDAVVESTAEATGTIMDVCDVLQEIGGAVGGDNGYKITNEVMKIYEACSFQDITGQRITNVVNTIEAIEEKVDTLLSALGTTVQDSSSSTEDKDTRTGDEALLNGPQMKEDAISQDEIDKLLAEFD